VSQGPDQLDTSPSENAEFGAEELSIDSIAEAIGDDGEEEVEGEELDTDEVGEEKADDDTDDKPTGKRKIKVGDQELDEDEVIAGYQRHADYTRKTQEVAEAKRAVEAERQRIAAEREERVNVLDVLIARRYQELVGIDQNRLNQLLESDPKAYLKAKEHIDNLRSSIQADLQQRQALSEQAQQQQARELAEYAREQEKALPDKIPQWRDPKRREAESRELAAYLRSTGYAETEISELYDARAVAIARKAMLFDKLQAAKGQKAPATPPAAQIRPGAANPTNQQAVRQKVARERLRSNPNSIDALAALVSANS